MYLKNDLKKRCQSLISEQQDKNNYRTLKNPLIYQDKINLAKNDYLGLNDNPDLFEKFINNNQVKEFGSTGSRLLTGNHLIHEELEEYLKNVYGKDALVVNSGFDANELLIKTFLKPNDVVFVDKLNHASIMSACFDANVKIIPFKHLDNNDLETKLKKYRDEYQVALVISESLFSMDGDVANLDELVKLKNKYNALLFIDEAHSIGVFGQGKGLAYQLDLVDQIDFIMLGFGKAICSSGAALLMDNIYKEYIINFGKKFIFTTAPAPIISSYNLFILDYVFNNKKLNEELWNVVNAFNQQSPIMPIEVGSNEKADLLFNKLLEKNIVAFPIKYPTVPKNKARLRVVLRANLTSEEIKYIKGVLHENNLVF